MNFLEILKIKNRHMRILEYRNDIFLSIKFSDISENIEREGKRHALTRATVNTCASTSTYCHVRIMFREYIFVISLLPFISIKIYFICVNVCKKIYFCRNQILFDVFYISILSHFSHQNIIFSIKSIYAFIGDL